MSKISVPNSSSKSKQLSAAEQILFQNLQNYAPFSPTEAASRDQMLTFLTQTPDCFVRNCSTGHFVGGAWLLSPDHQKVLFTHHKKLDQWLQLGGHADGQQDLSQVALREAAEESGIEEGIKLVSPSIFDLDAHSIPANITKNEPAHWHFELRYLLVASHENFTISSESNDLRWFTLSELQQHSWPESISRMIEKWGNLQT